MQTDAPARRLRNYRQRVRLYERQHDLEAQMEAALESKDPSYWSIWSKYQDNQEKIARANAMRETLWQEWLQEKRAERAKRRETD